jgi:hypothetical protein
MVKKNKSEYEKSMRVLDQSKAENERAQNLNELYNSTKVKKKLEMDKKKSESCEKRYRRAVEKTQKLEVKLFDTEMPKILSDFEQMERTRISTIKSCLQAFSGSHEGMIPQLTEICSSMNQQIDTIQPDTDVDQFILDKRTGKNKHTSRTEYEDYNPQFKSCVKEGAVPPLGSRNSMSLGSNDRVVPPQSNFQSSNPLPPNPTAGATHPGQVPYQSTSPLPPNQGMPANAVSYPQLTSQNSNSGMLLQNPQAMSMGQLAPVQSATQSFSHPIAQSQPIASAPQPPATKGIGTCRALHDYTASQPTELSFK